jgi:hypothetical protein
MDSIGAKHGESPNHIRLKRLALIWAQSRGYRACGVEVTLPRCRYRADVAAFKAAKNGGTSAIFECKQSLVDLRRDNGCAAETRKRLQAVQRRRETIERNLRVHYPALRVPESLFTEFDPYNFEHINHRGYGRVLRQVRTLQNRLFDSTKFEKLVRYRCANLLFLVLPNELYRQSEIPVGWGALVECNNALELVRRPVWHETTEVSQWTFLQRLAVTGTRGVNRAFAIDFEQTAAFRVDLAWRQKGR